eukprot:8249211-Alexandrium_andersonii.AAC.1
MRYQAVAAGALTTFSEIMSDPQKAAMALDKFRKENYIAGKFRKKLIDWAHWKRSFGIRMSFTERCGE